MEKQGLDYNTQREPLALPEYGREIQKMVDYAIQLPTKEERLRCAEAIIKQMLNKVPQIRENTNYKQTLWDHLYIMRHKNLDIDWPCDISGAEKIHAKPGPLKLSRNHIHMRYYGKLVEDMLEKLKDKPKGPERDELLRLTANQMKHDLMQWGHGSIDDEKVIDDIARLTDGAIQVDLDVFQSKRPMRSASPAPKKFTKKRR
jgi:hypothetical protein